MDAAEEAAALEALAETLGLAYYGEIPDAFLMDARTLPAAWARSRCLLPARIGGRDILFTAAPDDIEALESASRAAGCAFEPAVAPRAAIEAALGRAGAAGAKPMGAVTSDKRQATSGFPSCRLSPSDCASAGRGARIPAPTSSAPATRYIDALLLRALAEGASDIHIEPFADGAVTRFRLDGVLHRREPPPEGALDAVVSRLKVMGGMDISERRLPQDGMAEVKLGGRAIDIRISSIPVAAGERIVLRLLNRADAHLPLGDLGMDGTVLAAFRSLVAAPNGIIAISGPTGSGKTTTLYAALGEIDSATRNVLTIEDPVEYRLPGIGQMQVKPKIGLTFASGLRHILRQDPDVILVGETRDPETAEIAVRASLTGHLVLTTLHTNDAPSAVVRLTDMGVPPYLVASSLRGVLAQRLVRRLCPHCRRHVAPSPEALARPFVDDAWRGRLAEKGVFAATGCDRCFGGHRGRSGIFELMLCTEAVAAQVRDGAGDAAALRNAAGPQGFFPMASDALAKVAAGETDLDEVAGVLA